MIVAAANVQVHVNATGVILLVLVVSGCLLVVWHRMRGAAVRHRRESTLAARHTDLAARQAAIQAVLDELGRCLQDETTDLAAGEAAISKGLAKLRALASPDADLADLIADTATYGHEWLQSKRHA